MEKNFTNFTIEELKILINSMFQDSSSKSSKITFDKEKEKIIFSTQDYILTLKKNNDEVKISQELFSAFEKAKQNRFIEPFLSEGNIIHLTEKFNNEKSLIKALNFAYKKINREFKNFTYLEKTLKMAMGNEDKKLIVID